MKRLSPSFAVAFCFSLLLASTALLLLDRQARTSLGWIEWSAVHGQYAKYDQSTGYVRVPMAMQHQTAKKPMLQVIPPQETPPPPVVPPPVDPFLEQLGDHEGGGLGINSAPGEKPMESPFADPEHAHEQPMLSHDPQRPGPLMAKPARSQVAPGQNGGGGTGLIKPRPNQEAMKPPQMHDPIPKPATPQPPQPKPQPAVQATPPPVPPQNPAPQPKPAPTPVPDKMIAIGPAVPTPTTKPVEAKAESEKRKAETKNNVVATTKPVMAEMPSTRPAVAAKPSLPTAVPPAAAPITVAMATPASPADPSSPPPVDPADTGVPGASGAPGPEAAAADPAPQSDMESFAVVAKNPNLRLVPGATKAQFGRRWKPKELPRLDVAAWDHIRMTMDDLYVVLELRTDPDGNVTRVRVLHSAGFEAIDMPCQRAAYTWWFEPPVDKKTKKPQSDVFLFSIVFF